MPKGKTATTAKIVRCMKEEFLTFGYERASLNRVLTLSYHVWSQHKKDDASVVCVGSLLHQDIANEVLF